LPTVRSFVKQGFKIFATSGTGSFLKDNGIKMNFVNKVAEGSPHIVDLLESDRMNIVINTTETRKSINDSFSLRRTALNRNVPYFLTVSGARAAINSIKRLKSGEELTVHPISEYH
jgi:carbamoyl-phosphate synthase large subunit